MVAENANDGLSIFGLNPDNGRDPIIFLCMLDEAGEIVGDKIMGFDSAYARAVAKRLLDEADAVDAGERPASEWRDQNENGS
jgi:hypothetical protein